MKPHFLPELDTKVRESTFNILQYSFTGFLEVRICVLDDMYFRINLNIPYIFQSQDLLVSFRRTVAQSTDFGRKEDNAGQWRRAVLLLAHPILGSQLRPWVTSILI